MTVQAIHKPNMDVTFEGEQKIKRWLSAQESVARAKRELNRLECEAANAHNDLAKWMIPGDAAAGEKFCVWYGDSLIQVEVIDPHNFQYAVTIRKRGRALNLS